MPAISSMYIAALAGRHFSTRAALGEAILALFEGEEGGVADEDGGVGVVEHAVEVGSEGKKGD